RAGSCVVRILISESSFASMYIRSEEDSITRSISELPSTGCGSRLRAETMGSEDLRMRSRLKVSYSFGLATVCQNRTFGTIVGTETCRFGFVCLMCTENCAHHVSGRHFRTKFNRFHVTQSSL